jgi:F0F1-type ATP synthase delta subunit
VYYRPEELPEIKEYLAKKYNKTFKSLSFLLHSEHGFDQAPLEEISEDVYKIMTAQVKPITKIDDALDFDESADCATGACPVR